MLDFTLPCLAQLYMLFSLCRFTAAVRTAFNFSGNEILTFSGGEELWVYIDKTLVVQIFTDPSDTDIPCRTISLANAGKLKCAIYKMLEK